MRELLDEIDGLERDALRPPGEEARPGEDSGLAAGSTLNTRLDGLRAQLQGLMQHAMDLEEEIAQQDPMSVPRRREPRDSSLLSAAALPDATENDSRQWTQNTGEEREIHEITVPRRPEISQSTRREVPDETESQGLTIRVIPPEPPDTEGKSGSTDLTLVFDLGPRQAPIRVTLPMDGHIHEYSSNLSTRRSEVTTRPIPLAVFGIAALAIVLIGVWFISTVWAGTVASRAATATSQIEQSTPVRPTQTSTVGGESRALREQPSTRAPIVTSIVNGTRVEVLDGAEFAEGFHWLRVRTADGKVGWVASAVQRSAGNGDSNTPTPEPER